MLSGIEAGLAAATLGIWVYLFFFRGWFWTTSEENTAPAKHTSRVVAVVPARNEANLIAAALRSLLAQHLPVVLVDDESTDRTAEAALSAAPTESSLMVVRAGERPEGWTGKMWAVARGVQQASRLQAEYVLLTDADVVHAPDSVARLLAIAKSGGYDLVSWMVHLHCSAWFEKTLVPAFVFFFFKLYPPAWISNRRYKTAGAAGGCMLVRFDALTASGGIESIRGEMIDDCALAARIKSHGGRVWLGITDRTKSIRPYRGIADAWRMIARTAYTQLRYSVGLLFLTCAGMLVTYVAPVYLAFAGTGAARAAGIAAWMLMAIAYIPMLRRYRVCWALAFTLPLTAVFYLAATIGSATNHWRGKGGQWKGRIQGAAPASRIP